MDSELLAKCRAGDPQAIEALVTEYQARIYRLCLSILEDADDAQDAVQETFIAGLKALHSYRGDSAFQTWFFSIAINTCRGQLRQRKRKTHLQESLADPVITAEERRPGPEQSLIDTQRSQAIWLAIGGLDEKHRLPIILRYYHELSTQEIAETLGLNIGTVHSRLSIARTRLIGELKRANIDLPGGEKDQS
ncbi:MAG: RNA polymerase sigma factor [Anaerolineales bacterium]